MSLSKFFVNALFIIFLLFGFLFITQGHSVLALEHEKAPNESLAESAPKICSPTMCQSHEGSNACEGCVADMCEDCSDCAACSSETCKSCQKKDHRVDQGTNDHKQAAHQYLLGADDELEITVFGEDDLTGEYRINSEGSISMPLIGEVALSGLSVRQAEALIRKKLSDGFLMNPDVTLELMKYRPFYIMGEVERPGSYDYVSNLDVLRAIALAGGFTYRAVEDEVKILRIEDGGRSRYQEFSTDEPVLPGDIILVEERFF